MNSHHWIRLEGCGDKHHMHAVEILTHVSRHSTRWIGGPIDIKKSTHRIPMELIGWWVTMSELITNFHNSYILTNQT